MEPTQPKAAPEQAASRPVEGEKAPESTPAEVAAAPSTSAPSAGQPASATPPPSAKTDPTQAAPTQKVAPVTGPAVANDQDVIEKEWVDKVDEVVKKTAGNPHAEEEQIEDLQTDYLKKRYNKDIHQSEN